MTPKNMKTMTPLRLQDAKSERLTHPKLLSVPEAADTLGIGPRCAWALISKGDLPSVKIGRRRLVDSRDIASFIDARKERCTR